MGQISFSIAPFYFLSIPISVTEVISFNKHHVELGFGYNLIPEWTLSGRVGYRYQKPDGNFVFRASFVPIGYDVSENENMRTKEYDYHSWGAITFGYNF